MDETLQSRAEQLAEEFAGSATTIEELNGLMRLMMKSGLERMLNTEMDVHLGRQGGAGSAAIEQAKRSGNRRNGRSKKTVQGELGEVTLDTPRDRNGTFEPQIVGKHQRRIPDFDEKILALYAKGMTTRDIQAHLEEMYGVEVSPTLISQVTRAVQEEITLWQNRPLDEIYPIVYLDAIRIKVRQDGRVINKAVYLAIGINLDGIKEVLGMWTAETEGAKFWLQVVTELQNRGVKDIFIACVDGLKGFPEAIEAIFPNTEVQLCVVHQIRNS